MKLFKLFNMFKLNKILNLVELYDCKKMCIESKCIEYLIKNRIG